jgi:hypothetical protein
VRYHPLPLISSSQLEREWHQKGFTLARRTDQGKAPATPTPPTEAARAAFRLGWSVYRSRSGSTQICDYPGEATR